jgi:hypothetical protein
LAKREILAGSTDQTVDVFIQDVNGSPLTGLVYNSSGLTCYYRKGAAGSATALTLATQTVGGAHSDGGFVAVDGTNMPGVPVTAAFRPRAAAQISRPERVVQFP